MTNLSICPGYFDVVKVRLYKNLQQQQHEMKKIMYRPVRVLRIDDRRKKVCVF